MLGLDGGVQLVEAREDVEARLHRQRGVVLMRDRPAEPGGHAVAGVDADAPAQAGDRLGREVLEVEHDLPELLGVHALRERSGLHDVAEEHRELSSLALRHRLAVGVPPPSPRHGATLTD
jgi:hypothetical protein